MVEIYDEILQCTIAASAPGPKQWAMLIWQLSWVCFASSHPHFLHSDLIVDQHIQTRAMMSSIRCGAPARPCPKAACVPRCSTGASGLPERPKLVSSSFQSSSGTITPHLEGGSSRRQQLLAAAAVGALLLLQQPARAAEVPKGPTVAPSTEYSPAQAAPVCMWPMPSTKRVRLSGRGLH